MATEEEMAGVFRILCTYLLYERQEETEVRLAFAALVQERHTMFHCGENEKTDFTECPNSICINALKILQEARKPRIELNDFSLEMIKNFNLKIQKASRQCIAYLEQMSELTPPKDVILKVNG